MADVVTWTETGCTGWAEVVALLNRLPLEQARSAKVLPYRDGRFVVVHEFPVPGWQRAEPLDTLELQREQALRSMDA